jgi:hypothetical protein
LILSTLERVVLRKKFESFPIDALYSTTIPSYQV